MADTIARWGHENQRSGDPKNNGTYRCDILETLMRYMHQHRQGMNCLRIAWCMIRQLSAPFPNAARREFVDRPMGSGSREFWLTVKMYMIGCDIAGW